MQAELEWQKGTSQFLQEASGTLLDLQGGQEEHAGFTSYCDKADSLINW
ncbi:MAG: hypothetical protein AAF915_23620 [Cyanobacteria bacterium P01_D01_bin.50]